MSTLPPADGLSCLGPRKQGARLNTHHLKHMGKDVVGGYDVVIANGAASIGRHAQNCRTVSCHDLYLGPSLGTSTFKRYDGQRRAFCSCLQARPATAEATK
eukprot:24268-Eustigmatos_ZCMA.PRE.1